MARDYWSQRQITHKRLKEAKKFGADVTVKL
jgi:hypothetical protein